MNRQKPIVDLIREVLPRSFLRDVAQPMADAIVREAVVHRVRAGDLYMEQTEEHRCGILLSGLFRVFVANEDGRERTLREVLPGGAVGVAAFSGLPNAVSVQALVDSHVLDIDPQWLTGQAAAQPILAMALLSEVSHRLRDTEAVLASELGSVRQRMAARLLEIAAATRDDMTLAHVGHAALAAQLGCSREWVTRTLRSFASDGLVAAEGRNRIRLCDLVALRAVARAWQTIEGRDDSSREAADL